MLIWHLLSIIALPFVAAVLIPAWCTLPPVAAP